MYRILFYKTLNQTETKDSNDMPIPVTWLDGIYSKNEIPYPILFNKKPLLHSVSKELILEKGQRYIELSLNQILRIESSHKGTTLFLENNTFWTTEKTIELFESDLKNQLFFRVNENHLVNLNHIERFIVCDAIVTLSNKESIPVDSVKKEQILKFLEGKQII